VASEQTRGERLVAWVSGREQRKGLRPRDAATLIISVWFLAIVVFGITEHLVEPKTFPTVWLGMWWALETVTTVGYGDVVPVGAIHTEIQRLHPPDTSSKARPRTETADAETRESPALPDH